MEKLVTSIDQHGRVLIPVEVRQMFELFPGDKVNLEISDNALKIISANQVIDEMHSIFTKNKPTNKSSVVDDFISKKRAEYQIEENRNMKSGK